ncbi:hypothetical protein EOA24_31660, partial [Mesorhizobium sp. M2A.F.Ca.ET.039.01.1.1]
QRAGLAREIRKENYQAAYMLTSSTKAALVPWLAGIPERIGYPREFQCFSTIHVLRICGISRASGAASGEVATSIGCPGNFSARIWIAEWQRMKSPIAGKQKTRMGRNGRYLQIRNNRHQWLM